jgi:hypothetical protein
MDKTTVDAVVEAPAKSWYSLSPRTRDLLITAVMVGGAVYLANKLSAVPTESVINVDTVTL